MGLDSSLSDIFGCTDQLRDLKGDNISRDKICNLIQKLTKQKNLAGARHVKSLMQEACLVSVSLYGDYLIRMFASCGSLVEAEQAFFGVSRPTVYTWNAIISAYANSEDSAKALDFYNKMQLDPNVKADKITLLFVLKSCSKVGSHYYGHLIHSQVWEQGLGTDLVIGNALIDMYSKCGMLDDSYQVFIQMANKDLITWGAMIGGYALHRKSIQALQLLTEMYRANLNPNRVIYLSCFKACSSARAIQFGNLLYGEIIEQDLDSDVAMENSIIDMYVKCKNLEDAQKVFDSLPCHTVVSFGAMLTGYVQYNQEHKALELFQIMQKKNIKPNAVIFLFILKACGNLQTLDEGKLVHKQVRNLITTDINLGNAVMDMYIKCGHISDGSNVFYEMQQHDLASFHILIVGYLQHGQSLLASQLFDSMQEEGIIPDRSTFLHALGASSNLVAGQMVHIRIAKEAFDSDIVVGTALIDMYAKNSCLIEARDVFDSMASWDIITWGAMIAGYAEHGNSIVALQLFEKMQECGAEPSAPVILSTLKACANMQAVSLGRLLHDKIINNGDFSDTAVSSSLIDMYCKCGSLPEAYSVFRNLLVRDVVSWNTMISGYAQYGHNHCALQLYSEMLEEDFIPDEAVYLSVMKACINMKSVYKGSLVYNCILCFKMESNIVIGTAIVDLYVNCGSLDDAQKVFSTLPKDNAESWAVMMWGYVYHGDTNSALKLFDQMRNEKIELDKVTILSLLKLCTNTGAIKHGRIIHDLIIVNYLQSDLVFGNTLVDMYAKCGCIYDANNLFNSLPTKDMISWGAIASAHAQYGQYERVIECIKQMKLEGLKPNKVIFTNLLSACSHRGIFEDGCTSFRSMIEEQDIMPDIEHYSGMSDLFSRAGHLDEAEDLIQTMPRQPDQFGWTSLLTNCNTYGNIGIGNHCFKQFLLDPDVIISKDHDSWDEISVEEIKKDDCYKQPGNMFTGNQEDFIGGANECLVSHKATKRLEKLKNCESREENDCYIQFYSRDNSLNPGIS